MKRVVAQGTFDILHPGHVHYLREARSMGDELHVIVARGENVTHKKGPVISDRQRVDMVDALDPVEQAHLGHLDDIFVPIERLDPDVIVLGHDQYHDNTTIERKLHDRGIDCTVRRASRRDPTHEDEILSSRAIIEKIVEERS